MKKTLLTLALATTVFGIVGCAPAGNTSSQASTPSSSGVVGRNLDKSGYQITEEFDETKPVTIEFYSTMGTNLQPIFDEYFVADDSDFKKAHPNITITHSQPGSYDQVRDQIKTELSNNGGPDLAYCYPDHVALYNKTKTVIKLDNFITDPVYGLSRAQEQDFIAGYYNEGKQFGDGKMYSLPFSKSTEVLYYNETVLTAQNLQLPTTWFSATYDAAGKPTDVTSMEYVCAKLLEYDPNCVPLGYDSEANFFITLCEQMNIPYTSASGDHFLFNNDQAKEVMYKLNQWRQKGYFTTQNIYGSYTSGLFTETGEGQKSYMSIGSSAGATHQRPTKADGAYPFNVGIAQIPQADATNKKVISQGPSVCVFNHNDKQKALAAWLLLKEMTTNTAFQADFSAASGYVPCIKSVAENATYAANLAKANGGDYIAYLSAKVCLEQVDNYFTSPAFVGSSAARDAVGTLLQSCAQLTGTEAEVKEAIATKFAAAITECEYNS